MATTMAILNTISIILFRTVIALCALAITGKLIGGKGNDKSKSDKQ